MTDDPEAPTYDSNFMGIALVGINALGFIALLFGLLALHPAIRRRLNKNEGATVKEKFDAPRNAARNATKVTPSMEPHRYADGTLKTAKDYYADQNTTLSVHSGQSRPEEVQNWADWSEDGVENTTAPRVLDVGSGLLKKKNRTGLKREKTTRQELRDVRSEYGTESKEYQTAIKNMR